METGGIKGWVCGAKTIGCQNHRVSRPRQQWDDSLQTFFVSQLLVRGMKLR